jgi:chemotaxis protein MotA
MNWINLLDGPSAGIVLGGTVMATLLRCGWRDCGIALTQVSQLGQPGFDAEATQAELALQVQDIHQDGLLCAPVHHYADSEFEEATEALFEQRSLTGVLDRHAAHRARRMRVSDRAVRTLAQAAELAPVFGLAGTLISLSQLPADGLARGALGGAISMAVLTTLYGLLLANLLLAPLARMVERKAKAEEEERQRLIDWLAARLAIELQPRRPANPAQIAA